jgi:hypothetical protein
MTVRARLVLSDCKEARAELVDGVQGSLWRRRWTTVVTLLRATLHTLAKADAVQDPALADALNTRWDAFKQTKPVPEILWSFIEEDRNLILKEYSHRAGQSAKAGAIVETTYHMNSGPFAGRDPRDIATEAIQWVERLLDDLDADVAAAATRPAKS